MNLWRNIFAAVYDRAMAGAERACLGGHRERLLASAAGRVLEIGGGTGANLPFYGDGVLELVVAEPEEPMARRLEKKTRGYRRPARVVRAVAEQLPFDPESFDCAVSALVLCTVGNPVRALTEVRRLLRPNGRLLFIEHVRSDEPDLARWQDRLRRPWAWLACGCQPNRRTVDAMRAAGFSIAELRHDWLDGLPRIVAPLVVGVAVRIP